jgi:beta-lactamase class D
MKLAGLCAFLLLASGPALTPRVAGGPGARSAGSCFLLYEVGVGELRRDPGALCNTRLLPASTFKVPHALAALDAGIVRADTKFAYDGSPLPFAAWRRDHTLASAMRYSVVWYFQRIAKELGPVREREALRKLDYGNAAGPTSNLTSFWLDGSLKISPEEQLRFLRRLFADDLPVSRTATQTVRDLMVQPQGRVTNAAGEQPFAAPWPSGTVLRAKTGSGTDRSGQGVRWLVGHVARGSRSWIFVSCVAGSSDIPALAAIELAASALREESVLREARP